ncbi:MAG: efflux RND transporter periplasmic adaptor subunit [Polaromonas sp.]|nr:efflux RND transporter periplasmic adaptor subunit [Polaromonas sp.]
MKSWGKWLLVLLVLAIIAGTALRIVSDRKAKQQALAVAPKQVTSVELADSDVVKAQKLEISQGLTVSGSLKAVNSAVIKARVAGELQGLTVREGDFIKAGQIIARIDASDLQSRVRQAREQADSAKAQVDVAQRQYDNNKALVDQGFISKTALDTSLANLNAAQSTYQAALAGTDVAKKSVDDTVLKAPISGQVAQRMAQTGERVGIDARIIEIVDLSRLELEAALSAADSTQIQVGQTAELQIEGSPKAVMARVVRINPTAQAGSRSVLAYLSIENSAASASQNTLPFRQGLFAQGTLGTARASLLAVPLASVRTDKPAPYVQAIENGQVVHKTVELGARGSTDGVDVVAVTGLNDSAVVIRGNIGSLREGTQVKFTSIGMTAASPAASNAKPAP